MISFDTKDFIKHLKSVRQIEDTSTISNFISIIYNTINVEKESLLKNDIKYLEKLYKEFKIELSNFNNWVTDTVSTTSGNSSVRSSLQRKVGYPNLGESFYISNEEVIKKINSVHINKNESNKNDLLFEYLYGHRTYLDFFERFLKSKNNASKAKEVINKIIDIKPTDCFDDDNDYI